MASLLFLAQQGEDRCDVLDARPKASVEEKSFKWSCGYLDVGFVCAAAG